MTVRDLRRRWKPTKDRVGKCRIYQPLLIRIHRACSWLARVEQLSLENQDDRLVFQWIALNALYGQWDEARREPRPDNLTLPAFLERVLALDAEHRIAEVLKEQKELVMSIFEDEYLTKFFWAEPSQDRARKSRSTMYKSRSWYVEARFGQILERVLERIYLLRCQIFHGAATYGGKPNRAALQRCSELLGRLVTVFLLVIMDHGVEEDWGPLCYEPYPLGD